MNDDLHEAVTQDIDALEERVEELEAKLSRFEQLTSLVTLLKLVCYRRVILYDGPEVNTYIRHQCVPTLYAIL